MSLSDQLTESQIGSESYSTLVHILKYFSMIVTAITNI